MGSEIKKLYTNKAVLYHFLFIDFLGFGRKLKTFFRTSDYIHPYSRILDAGCGTGIVTRTLYELSVEKKCDGVRFYGFDFTPRMLEVFKDWTVKKNVSNITLARVDVMCLERLSAEWKNFDLVVTSGMLEYIAKKDLKKIIGNVMGLLKSEGILLIFITRQNFITQWLVGKLWKANIYTKEELGQILRDMNCKFTFKKFARAWWDSTLVIEIGINKGLEANK